MIYSGDDWEHEEIFTDDDEAVGNDPEEREDLLAPEIPAPPEIKQVCIYYIVLHLQCIFSVKLNIEISFGNPIFLCSPSFDVY